MTLHASRLEGLDLDRLAPEELRELLALLEAQDRWEARRRFFKLFPDETVTDDDGFVFWARHLYPKHLEFFAAGARFRERCFMAANRVGKTVAGAFEVSTHATGLYPHWWEGKRFRHPTRIWAAGKTNETTRDIVQRELFGDVVFEGGRKGFSGTGLIPGDRIAAVSWKQGVADLADAVKIKHESLGFSWVGLKSYQQGRGSFEGTAQHVIWFDEEPPIDVYGEALMRTATTGGSLILTFTPLEGVSETVLQFMPGDQRPDSFEG